MKARVIEFENGFQLDLDIIWGVGERRKLSKRGDGQTFFNVFYGDQGKFTIYDTKTEFEEELYMKREVFLALFNDYKQGGEDD